MSNDKRYTKGKVMERIRKEEINIKPKWWWKLGDGLVRSSWTVVMLIQMWIGVGLRWWWEFFSSGEWLQYGQFGREVVWEEAPKWWILGLVIGATILGWWYRRLGENYRKSTVGVQVVVWILVLAGMALWWLGRNWWELTVLLQFI